MNKMPPARLPEANRNVRRRARGIELHFLAHLLEIANDFSRRAFHFQHR